MPKFLLISGSPRCGNTEFILKKIFAGLKTREKKLVLLKNKKIAHCKGCSSCDKTNRCVIRDDMDIIAKNILWANILIIGTPNYFDNVSGLLKDFIDRTNFLSEGSLLQNKKLVAIIVGGGKIKNSKRICDGPMYYFAVAHKIKMIGCYCFQALEANEVQKNPQTQEKIKEIIRKLNSLK